jgi:2-keto-4-pentenoate hydratase/2-oxohepta-3-ene-1,7-dioic acid hydratase in catechol pathway
MKLLRVGLKGKERPAILDENGKIRDISPHIRDLDPNNLNFETISKLKKIDLKKLPELLKTDRIGPCVSKPEKFIGIGLNYSAHAKETDANTPKEPIVFFKANSSICGPNDDVYLPKKSSKSDWEVELGVIIGKQAKNISKEESMDHIFGFCIVNDISEREYQLERSSGQWDKGKAFDTFGPIGPYIVTKDEIKNVQNLNLQLKINGKIMQEGNTQSMIFEVKYLISYLSFFMTLKPGDIITTGTPPGCGIGRKPQIFLKSGDEMELQIDNLGLQKQKVK